jgi:hypothetical protein
MLPRRAARECLRVIASQQVRAKRGPTTGSAKQSTLTARKKEWIASSQMLLAMTL